MTVDLNYTRIYVQETRWWLCTGAIIIIVVGGGAEVPGVQMEVIGVNVLMIRVVVCALHTSKVFSYAIVFTVL